MQQTPWHKMTNPDFDVTMGSYDGTETCELVGLYLSHIVNYPILRSEN